MQGHQSTNVIIFKKYYPIKEHTYEGMISEVRNQNITRFKKRFISGASVKATLHLAPLKVPSPENQVCQISKKNFFWHLTINYHLPHWKSRHLAKKSLQRKWDNYLKKLINHEDKHRDIFLKGASSIRNFLNNIPPFKVKGNSKDCLYYVAMVKEKVLFIFKMAEKENLKFDLNSNFGKKNGLFF